jgi:hypothetical protein
MKTKDHEKMLRIQTLSTLIFFGEFGFKRLKIELNVEKVKHLENI